jgi:hypothetical protein
MLKSFYVYVYFKPDGSPFYIGKGSGNRAKELVRNRNVHFKRIIEKYGKSNIKFVIFNCDSEDAAFSKEIELIKSFKNLGFVLSNMTDGGEGVSGVIHSEETKRKLSLARLGKSSWNKGKPHSEETKRKLSEANLGYKHSDEAKLKIKLANMSRTHKSGYKLSDEHKNKISVGGKGKVPWNKGIKLSDEHKAKLSKAHIGQIPWNKRIE